MNFETYALIGIVISLLLLFIVFRSSAADKEYKQKLKESLEDEFIIDPETGVKLTLEEAESGHWVAHDNEFAPMAEGEIEKLYSEEQKDGERALNYLKELTEYRKQDLSEKEIKFLNKTKMLSKYDDWSYSNSFRIEYCQGMVFLPAVYLSDKNHSYLPDSYEESQILFWIKLDIDFGHYYLREKTETETFFDSIRNDDDLQLTNYESFTFKTGKNILRLQHMLATFEGENGLEIEFMGKNLFVKNLKYINSKDLMRMERVIKKCLNV